MIVRIFSCGPIETNCILLGEEGGRGIIIDAPPGSWGLLQGAIETLGLEIEALLLTHTHWDHIADAGVIKKALNVPIYVHPLDAENLKSPGADGLPSFMEMEGIEPDALLEDGQVLTLASFEIRAIHTPGHSPGGVCFYIEAENFLASGDTLFQGSIGRLDLPTGDPAKMWESLKKLSTLPPQTRTVPGHGGETTIGQEPWLAKAETIFGG